MKFMVTVCPAFLARVKPVSTIAKPSCMNITRKPATSVQTMLIAAPVSATVFARSAMVGGAGAADCASTTEGAATAASSAPAIKLRRTCECPRDSMFAPE